MRRQKTSPSKTLLPLVENNGQSSPSNTSRRRKRKRHRTNNDWLSLDRATLFRLGAVGVLAFCGVHLYLLHSIVIIADTEKLSDLPVVRNDGKLVLSPLREMIDYQQYTIRINTWKRLETLKVSLEHHVTCPGVAQIQVVWCDDQGLPPDWLLHWPDDKVVIEHHKLNSLNERFRLQKVPPTTAILSLDDDIIRPCLAYDWAFYKWTKNPDRIVGFDARSHEELEDKRWKYAYMSTTQKTNRYSLTLTRCCFLHKDYLRWYISSPDLAPIREFVEQHLNCEDIGMSMAVSSQTDGKPPLITDYWAVKSMVKLDDGSNLKISAGKDHKKERDQCVDQFADHLQLKDRMKPAMLQHGKSLLEYGDIATDWNARPDGSDNVDYLKSLIERLSRWKKDPHLLGSELTDLRMDASMTAYNAGLVEKSEPWKKRFHRDDPSKQ